jgi:hypothetical protein
VSGKAENLVLLPSSLAAVALLALNDHVLKAQVPGFWTGKLSDLAGLYFFPFFLLSVVATVLPMARSKRGLAVACVVTALVFSCVNLSQAGSDLYEHVVAHIWRWFGTTRTVRHVADAEDLATLPMVAAAYWVGAAHLKRPT